MDELFLGGDIPDGINFQEIDNMEDLDRVEELQKKFENRGATLPDPGDNETVEGIRLQPLHKRFRINAFTGELISSTKKDQK